MDNQTRLAIKKLILDESQKAGSDIKPLTHSNLEIICPESEVDIRLVRRIDLGHVPLIDELFFGCIEESIDYLAYEPFRAKIKEWQRDFHDFDKSKEKQKRAEDKLRILSHIISPKKPKGAPKKYPDREILIYSRYVVLANDIKTFTDGVKKNNVPMHERPKLFKVKFPDLDKYSMLAKKNREPRALAKMILFKKYNVSERKLYEMLKVGKEAIEKTQAYYSQDLYEQSQIHKKDFFSF